MAQPIMRPSLAAGELSPSLYGRVDLSKWQSGAALLENFFVDYRGGVSNRPGTKWLGFSTNSSVPSRLIPFIFSTEQAYVLVFEHLAMRVIRNGGFVAGSGVFSHYVLETPYAASDLALLKFTQSADVMTLVHPNYSPRQLTRTAHDNWILTAVQFNPHGSPPAAVSASPAIGVGTTTYRYKVTVIGENGMTESLPSPESTGAETASTMSATAGEHITVSWPEIPGAQLYNVYRQAEVPDGAPAISQLYGFVGTVENGGTGTASFVDANIAPDFTQTPPQDNNPFANMDSGVLDRLFVTAGVGYRAPPTLSFSGGGGGSGAAATVSLAALSAGIGGSFGAGYTLGDVLTVQGGVFTRPAQVRATGVITVPPLGWITDVAIVDPGDYSVLPGTPAGANQMAAIAAAGGTGTGVLLSMIFGLGVGTITNRGSGYNVAPAVAVTPAAGDTGVGGAVTASIVLQNVRNPTCATYYQQRQVFAAPPDAPETMYFSKTADYLNFNYSTPSRPDDSIIATLASQQVNAIKHLVPLQSLIALTSAGAWRIDSGDTGGAITPSTIEATPQVFNGASDVPPLVIGRELLFVQAKGSIVRDLAFNFIENVYSGNDLTTLANHLFFGHQIIEWAYAEEPFKIVWCVRDDGLLLSFTFLKEQEIYAWAHHVTEGKFENVCVIPEGEEDAVYVCVKRFIQGSHHRFIERFASRDLGAIPEGAPNLRWNTQVGGIQGSTPVPADLARAWFVDAGLQYPLTYPTATLTPMEINALPSIASGEVISGGSGYVNPLVVITDETGSGAGITAIVSGGVITGAIVTNQGVNYTNPTISVIDQGGPGTGAAVAVELTRDIVATSSVNVFVDADVGAMLRVNNGWATVRVVNGPKQITVNVLQPLTSTWPAEAGEWSCTRPVSAVSGLNHLEGETVAILADGNVMEPQQVVGGAIALEQPASAIFVGLPYRARFQSLYSDIPGEVPTVQGKRKKISGVTVRQQDSRGLRVGHNFTVMDEIKYRDFQNMGSPVLPFTGDKRINLSGEWDVHGQVCIEQPDPLPGTILALMPELSVGDTP